MGYANNIDMLAKYHRQKRKRTNSNMHANKRIKKNMNNVTINGLTYEQAREELLRPSARTFTATLKPAKSVVRFSTARNVRSNNVKPPSSNKLSKKINVMNRSRIKNNKIKSIGAFRTSVPSSWHATTPQMSGFPLRQLQAQVNRPTASSGKATSIARGVSAGGISQMMLAQTEAQHAQIEQLSEIVQLLAAKQGIQVQKMSDRQADMLQQVMKGQDFASIPWSQVPEWLKKNAKQAALQTALAPITVTKDLVVHGLHLMAGPLYNVAAITTAIIFVAGTCFVVYNVSTKVPGFSHVTDLSSLGLKKVAELIKFELNFVKDQGAETVTLLQQAGLDAAEGYKAQLCQAAGWKTKLTLKALGAC